MELKIGDLVEIDYNGENILKNLIMKKQLKEF